MPVTRLSLHRCLGVAALALVSACGGNSGDPPAETGNPAVALSVQNEPTLSAAAVQEFNSAQGIASRGAGTSPGQISIASRSAQRAMASVRQAGRVGALATEPFTDACSGGGSATLQVADDLLSFNVSFAACVEDGETLNGSVSVNLVSTSDDGLLQTFDVKLVGLAVTLGNTTDTLSGDLRMTLDAGTAGQTTTTFTSTVQTFEHSLNGQAQESRTLRDFKQTHVSAESGQQTDSFSFSSEGTLGSLGAVAYKAETLTALTTPPGAIDPVSGQIKVTVAGKGIILLTVEATRVHVQGDLEGNGSFEIDRFDTWSNLKGEL